MCQSISFFFFFNAPATSEIYTLSLHDALPIYHRRDQLDLERHVIARHHHLGAGRQLRHARHVSGRSEEHTSELQSPDHLVCRLLLEKKKKTKRNTIASSSTIKACSKP